MCDAAVREGSSSLIYFPDWFVRQQQVNMQYDDYYDGDNYDEVIQWHNGYQKHKAQKAKIKEELMPIASPPSGLAHVRRQEKADRKIVGVTDSYFKIIWYEITN